MQLNDIVAGNKIAICSDYPSSGKDTVADHLIDNYGYTRLSFATRIKEIAKELFPNKMVVKDRAVLIHIGSSMREIEENVWLNLTMAKADETVAKGGKVVISDLRFKNEYDTLKKNGFAIIRVKCDRDMCVLRAIARDGFCDVSLFEAISEVETRGLPVEIELDNTKGVELLHREIDSFLTMSKIYSR